MLEASACDQAHHRLVRLHQPLLHRRLQSGQRGRPGGLGIDAFFPDETALAGVDGLIGHHLARAGAGQHRVQGHLGVQHGGHLEPGNLAGAGDGLGTGFVPAQRSHHRGAPLGLGRMHPGNPVDAALLEPLPVPLITLVKQAASTDGPDDVIGGAAELLADLEGDGLHPGHLPRADAGGRDQQDGLAGPGPRLEPFHHRIGPGLGDPELPDPDHPGAVGLGLHQLGARGRLQHIQVQLEAEAGRIGGQGRAGIAGGGGQHPVPVFLDHQGGGHAGESILVGPRGVLEFQLEVEVVQSHGGTDLAAADQGGVALSQGGDVAFVLQGQVVEIFPHGAGLRWREGRSRSPRHHRFAACRHQQKRSGSTKGHEERRRATKGLEKAQEGCAKGR